MNSVQNIFGKLHLVVRLLITVLALTIVFGWVMHIIEPETFHTIKSGIWWAVQTMSTVGYGDIVPATIPGKFIALFVILAGGGFVAYFFASMSSHIIKRQTAFHLGTGVYKGDSHIIFVGWNERTKKMIQTLEAQTLTPLVVVDESAVEHPLPHSNVFFIRGDSTTEQVWLNTNSRKAMMVIITADPSKNEQDSDLRVISSLLALKGQTPAPHCICEILTPFQIQNAQRAGADEIIATNDLIGDAFLQLITKQTDDD
ncbi:potassium channel family protein [Bacillus sp. FJAT-27916]|uniref:potassium channel family protein n=1 Tax=Bacillus sp. FJAT-27916 TaxID=1679169 RepID=UPI000670F68E|nr:potassium channel family protein [Bacillus sp. FJAT-27916]